MFDIDFAEWINITVSFKHLCYNPARVGYEVLTAVVTKVAILWDTAPCNPCMNLPSHLLARSFLALLICDPENGDDRFLRNVSSYTDYTALYPRGNFQPSACIYFYNTIGFNKKLVL
jgi:hypothetical protein